MSDMTPERALSDRRYRDNESDRNRAKAGALTPSEVRARGDDASRFDTQRASWCRARAPWISRAEGGAMTPSEARRPAIYGDRSQTRRPAR